MGDEPNTSSAETAITRRDYDRVFDRPTNEHHTFMLRDFRLKLLEVEDVHFHFDSAVMMPDYGTCDEIRDAADENHVSGLAVLRACYLHAERMPSAKLLIAGHTDRSGSAAYNLELSELRANNVYHLLMGNRDDWVAICEQKHQTEDIQQILIWITAEFGWDTDPGPKNNVMNARTTAAVRKFQEQYNDSFDPDIGVDGDVGTETWGAFFDMYMMGLRRLMSINDAELQTKRGSVTFLNGGQETVGCGENHPVSANEPQNYRSRVDRRVEILYFDPPELPQMNCHPGPGQCEHQLCEIYGPNRIFSREPLPCNPADVGRRYRIRLELGDPNLMFPTIGADSAADAGIRQRLQAVGFLYHPLNSGEINTIATHAWDHFKTVTGAASDGAARTQLEQMVRDVIVDQNALPGDGEFKRLRMPGTYCVTNADLAGGFFGNPGTGQHPRFVLEQTIFDANPSLGQVPIIAVVEERSGEDWLPAPQGLDVHFQLIEPEEVPATDAAAPPALRSAPVTGSVNTHTNNATTPPTNTVFTFNMTGSPDTYITNERNRNATTGGDPQVDNAHSSVGGKRGNAAAGNARAANILQTDTLHPTFHNPQSLSVAFASSHSNAAKATTNSEGKAAVVFMPSRTGGDRFRLRAFVDPIPESGADQSSDGTEGFAVKADTGTFVVFKILRISKYMRWNYPGADPGNCGGPLNNFDTTGVIATEFSRGWLDVTVESLAQSPQQITQAQWRQAIRFARGRVNTGSLSQNYDLNTLLPDTTGTAGVHNSSAGLIRYRQAAPYDAAKGAAFPNAVGNANFLSDCAALMHAMSAEIMEFFTRNALGGISVIQTPVMTSLETDIPAQLSADASTNNWRRSGWGGMRRGCYVTFGQNVYASAGFPYDHNRNCMHEMGHTLYCPHQYTQEPQVNSSTGGIFDEHDYHDLCVMGYMNRRPGGDYCGRCALLFAGWQTHAMPANSPGP